MIFYGKNKFLLNASTDRRPLKGRVNTFEGSSMESKPRVSRQKTFKRTSEDGIGKENTFEKSSMERTP